MVIVETKSGVTKVRGRRKGEWMLVPYWPCSGRTIRKLARADLSKEWVDEVASFADEQFLEAI